MLIDYTYFNWEINIPNVTDSMDDADVAVRAELQDFIDKYETQLLRDVMGVCFYNAFVAGIQTTPPTLPDQRWQDLIYGVDYMDYAGIERRWIGLLDATIPQYSFGSGFAYKQPYWIQADFTAGFNSGTDTAVFSDWIGWTPVIERVGQGTLQEGVDYTFDTETGEWVLLTGFQFQTLERFYVSFQLQTQNADVIDSGFKQSLIANYVYYYWMRDKVSFTSSTGETKKNPTQGWQGAEVSIKMARAYNEAMQWLQEMWAYLYATQSTYPEYNLSIINRRKFNEINSYGI